MWTVAPLVISDEERCELERRHVARSTIFGLGRAAVRDEGA
jgi:hypothetical protein